MEILHQLIKSGFPSHRIISDPVLASAHSVDASFYRIQPKLVVDVLSIEEMAKLVSVCAKNQMPITFRAAGTSLSGQSQGSGVLARISKGWRKISVYDHGNQITLQPGVIGSHANEALKPYLKKLGPDPASINSCMIGGIAANNASGMCCGTDHNTYRTLSHLSVLLPPRKLNDQPSFLKTNDPVSRSHFLKQNAEIIEGLNHLRIEVTNNRDLVSLIKRKYQIKNTMGYSLNALIDFDDPVEILAHLMIGSEGTLGFISEITYHTVDDHPHKACAWVFLKNLELGVQAAMSLKGAGVYAVELMDWASLQSVRHEKALKTKWSELPSGAVALLIETRGANAFDLQNNRSKLNEAISKHELLFAPEFSSNPEVYDDWWRIRKGLFPALARGRKPGSTVIIEDVTFPQESFSQATVALRSLLDQLGYSDAIIFGHALHGNLHFVFNQSFDSSDSLLRYQLLMEKLAQLVVDQFGGSLKGEHGTGRNMSPFLEKEWGVEAYSLMKKIKTLFDPLGILNPGVLINDDPKAHLKGIKKMPQVDPEVDDCMECGYCESHCPSRDLTLTPRQRIALARESIGREVSDLKKSNYDFDQTCAADGMCATACPVDINTGRWIKKIRAKKSKHQTLVALISKFYFLTLWSVRIGFYFGSRLFKLNWLSKPTRIRRQSDLASFAHSPPIVYLPSCLSRTLKPSAFSSYQENLPQTMKKLFERAGYQVLIPKKIDSLCCGLAFESKGYPRVAKNKIAELQSELFSLSQGGRFLIVSDTTPCTQRLISQMDSKFKILDSTEWIHDYLLMEKTPQPVRWNPRKKKIALHVTCSSHQLGLAKKQKAIAQACAEDVVVPLSIECCGVAGDKIFTTPELSRSALQGLGHQVRGCAEGFSTSLSCEMGLTREGQIPYQSLVYLVEASTTR